jgi:hypothetical protein
VIFYSRLPRVPDCPSHLDQYGIIENLNNRRVALLSGYGERRPSVIRRLVDVRARLDQRPHYRLLAQFGGDVQLRHAVIIRLVDIRAHLDQQGLVFTNPSSQPTAGKQAATESSPSPLVHLGISIWLPNR